MKTFLKRLLIVSLPLMAVLIYVGAIFYRHNLHLFYVGKQNFDRVIIGEPYFTQLAGHYKQSMSLDNYQIVAVGSSRVLQFSAEMFKEPFFNLGYGVGSVAQIRQLIEKENIRGKKLIVSIDQWALNPNWPGVHDDEVASNDIYRASVFLNKTKLTDILKGKVYPFSRNELAAQFNYTLIGSGANLALDGFVNDGSYYYGKVIQGKLNSDPKLVGPDFQFQDTRRRIAGSTARFEAGSTVDSVALREIEQLISSNRERQNELYLFFPPFAPAVNTEMAKTGRYTYIPLAAEKVAAICASSGVKFFDFTGFGESDADFIDGFHAGKKVYYSMLLKMGIDTRELAFLNQFESSADSALAAMRTAFFKK